MLELHWTLRPSIFDKAYENEFICSSKRSTFPCSLATYENDRRILAIRKDDWDSLNIAEGNNENLVKLELEQYQPLPVSRVVIDSELIGGTAFRTGKEVKLKIYRKDPKSTPQT